MATDPPGSDWGIHDTRPARRWEDAYLSGNGEYGIMVLGDPFHERVVHTHHRFVQPNGSRELGPPAVAGRLDEVRDLILAGRRVDAQRAFSDGRTLAWTQPFHPGPVLHIDAAGTPDAVGTPDATGAPDATTADPDGYRRRTRFGTGEVTASWSIGGKRHRRRAFVSRPDRVVVLEIDGPGLDLDLRLSVDTPGRPASLEVTVSAGAGSAGEAELELLAAYPGKDVPMGFLGVTRLVVTGGGVSVSGGTVRVRAAARLLLLTRLERWTGVPRTGETRGGLDVLPADYAVLLERHVAVHGALFARCDLDLGASGADRTLPVAELVARGRREVLDPALVEALFASGRYLLLSSCGVLPPRLTGIWVGAWDAAWAGDLTTDANLNLQMAAVTITGMPELTAGYAAMLAGQIEDWRHNARAVYGVGGILAPSRTDGEHGLLFHLDDDWPWAMWLAGADWLLLPLVEYWQATGDDAFLADVLAPWLAEVATFFEEVLTRYDDHGYLVLVPSCSPETGPRDGEGMAGVNATMDLAAARHALTTAADVVERLGSDPDAPRRWRAVADRLPPYRVDARGALAEWAARLRRVGPARENLRKILGRDMLFRSLMTSHNPDLEIYNADAAHCLPAVVVEMLIDSRPGTVELLPALPREWTTGRLRGIRTRAGVRVSELAWDLNRGEVRAVLDAGDDRTVTVVCRAAREAGGARRPVRLVPGISEYLVFEIVSVGRDALEIQDLE